MRLLILGGTGEARSLAARLDEGSARRDLPGIAFTSSLAGRVSRPALPKGPVRIGGFGGIQGLVAYLRDSATDAVVDATHPFAAGISANAAAATSQLETPLLMLRRPGWLAGQQDNWQRVPTITAVTDLLRDQPPSRVLLTTGRRDLAVFAGLPEHHFVIRSVDPPHAGSLPPRRTLILARGPYTVQGETELMIEQQIDVLVTKDSGGQLTVAKLIAARELGVAVIMVDRPPPPTDVQTVETVEDALRWINVQSAGPRG
ncbi:MAG: precorrin-6A/cobalt-precorrin-6A reductase [Pseudonocardiales bacterium]|nr:precorrin-6A/cobalt-precorrin-6A reductase [Pseudonocardiales bacterium]